MCIGYHWIALDMDLDLDWISLDLDGKKWTKGKKGLI
jgi:hypothetical protein